MSTEYNLAAIRQLLKNAFSDVEINAFAFDHFPKVYENFGSGMGRLHKIQLLLEYCKRQGKLGELLAHVQQHNPYQYSNYLAAIASANGGDAPSSPATSQFIIQITLNGDFSKFRREDQKELLAVTLKDALAAVLEAPPDDLAVSHNHIEDSEVMLRCATAVRGNVRKLRSRQDTLDDLGVDNIIMDPDQSSDAPEASVQVNIVAEPV
ncbi:MAG: hypothetical protein AAF614_17435 [Chloroflexota bacterium]